MNETPPDTIRQQEHDGLIWIDVRRPTSDVFVQLQREYNLDPIHLTESVQKVQHTQVEREDNYLFLVLHFPVFERHTDEIFAGQLGVFLGKDYLVTIHDESSPFIDNAFAECQQSTESASQKFGKGSAYLLYLLIGRLLQDTAAMTDIVENELDEVEGLVFENDGSDAQRIGKLRQKIVRLRRLIGPKRGLLQDLAEEITSFAGEEMSKYYESNTKMANRLWEIAEEANETIEIYKDADYITSTEQTNKILAILTLVFTFTIPVTVLGTLYGMNVPMPGDNAAGAWTFLGQFTTFTLVSAISLAVAVVMYVYFRKKRWLLQPSKKLRGKRHVEGQRTQRS